MTGIQTQAVLQLVVDALLSSATVQDLVGNRIRGAFDRSSDEQTATLPKIAVEVEPGGRLWVGGSPAQYTIAIYALSDVDLDEAYTIYESARDVLHAEALCHVTNGHRGTANELQRPSGAWYEAGACWLAVGRFRLTVVR